NGLIGITNWEKHQSTDKMARMKEQSRIRQQKYYYRNKLRELGVDVDAEGFTDDIDELKAMYEHTEEPNVRLTLANETEVRSKKLEGRRKKEEVNKDHSSAKLTERFEALWKLYPRKQGKKDALKHYKRAVKEGTTDDEIEAGIQSYVGYIEKNSIDKRYVKHGSAWFNQEGWLDEYTTENQTKPSGNNFIDDLWED